MHHTSAASCLPGPTQVGHPHSSKWVDMVIPVDAHEAVDAYVKLKN